MNTKSIVTIVAACIAAILSGLFFYQRSYSMSVKLDAYINTWVQRGKFSGSVLVAQRGKVLLCKGYGMANYEHMVPNTPQTKFHIGSITKQFTSMAIMQLVQAGKLKLSDTIASIFPDYPRGKDITVYQLLTMTSGIPDYLNDFDDFDVTKAMILNDLIASFKNKQLLFAPGSKYKYSNSGYVLLAAIVEKLSGQSYETFVREHIFKPLGMNNTGMLHNNIYRAQGYGRINGKLQNASYYDPSFAIGTGGLYSTVEDMYLWDRALYIDKLLSRDLLKQLWQPYLEGYCLGWVKTTFSNHSCVWHNGGYCDCHSIIMRFMADDVCIIILGNFDLESSPIEQIAINLSTIVFGNPLPQQKKVAVVNPAVYDAYVGQYEVKPGFIVTIIKDGDRLFGQPTGQPAFELMPESETKFFHEEGTLHISFVKDAHGIVTQLILHQQDLEGDPKDTVAKKINNKGRVVVPINPVALDAYLGLYRLELKRELVLTVTKDHGQLFAQMTGQSVYPLFSESETKFFFKVADAQISFTKDKQGNIVGLILHQDGKDTVAKKME